MRARALLGGGAALLFAVTQSPLGNHHHQDASISCSGLAPPSACHAFTRLDQILRDPRWAGLGSGHRQSAKGVDHAAEHR
ncbi:hypothetical protein EOE18_10520 [Novosphingobium umbonatum]|uniref:Uncharacterized protein n=1 Tax=Novosphingobium umbonatum TaxID=1908524 RepID=A0A3S2Y6F0_9SPHN|nr:hypothetical protein EOE18_10520 [Novosphingobium umbonatum]